MKFGKLIYLFVFVVSILFFLVILPVSAVQVQNEISSEYFSEDQIQGWINISLNNELKTTELKAVFSDGITQSISLINFILPQNVNYSCSSKNCSDEYQTTGTGILSKSITLANNSNGAVLGVKVNGNNINIKNFEFGISSDAPASCNNQLTIDIIDDNSADWANKKIINEICGSEIKSLCNTGSFLVQGTITNVPYCEKIILPQAPAFKIKAGIQKQSGSVFYDGLLLAKLFTSGGTEVANCALSNPTSGSAQCDVEYSVKNSGEYYLCVSYKEDYLRPSETESLYSYKLSASQSGTHCGFLGDPAVHPAMSATYNITAYAKKYSSIGSIRINETSFTEQNTNFLISYINDYLQQKYNRDCSNDCIIPIKFSGTGQNLVINNLNVKYDSQGIADISENKIYDMEKTPAKINMNYSKLDLSKAGFKAPVSYGNYTLKLFLGTNQIAEKNISVLKREISQIMRLYPIDVAAANPTKMIIFVNPDLNLSGATFKWDFGDGSLVETTSTNKLRHTFSSIGNYSVKIEIYRGLDKISSKSFNINVQSPINVINSSIATYKQNINNFKTQLNALPLNYKNKINENVDVTSVESELTEIETTYKQDISSGATELEYIEIMSQLTALKVPTEIKPIEINTLKIINDLDIVDTDKISDLFSDSGCSDSEECNNAIVSWSINKVDISVANKVLAIYYTDSVETILSEFEIKILPKESMAYKGYVVINENSDNLIFDGEYDISEESADETGITFDLSNEQIIKFAVAGQSGIFDIPFYVSPELNKLNVSSPTGIIEPKSIWIFVLVFILLIFIALITYIFMKKWYNKNYESSLFKNKNDLTNLMVFVKNAKAKNISDADMKTRLKKAGWKGEQISYALNKVYGKSMWPKLFTFKRKAKPIKNPVSSNPFMRKP